eukprot:s1756_g2.t1
MGPPSDQLDPNKPEDRKLLRKRADSDAWHKTFKAESAENKDEEECYRLAREAARKAREDFDLKHPKPIAHARLSLSWFFRKGSRICLSFALHFALAFGVAFALAAAGLGFAAIGFRFGNFESTALQE